MKPLNYFCEAENSHFSPFSFLYNFFSISRKSKTLEKTVNFSKSYLPTNNDTLSTKPSEFLTSIVHELKTPLNSIIGLSDVMRDSVHYQSSPKELAEYARDINLAALELNELIHDLLDVEQATSGNFSVDLSKKINVLEVNSYVAIKSDKLKQAIDHFASGKIKGKKFKVGKA